MTIINSSAFTLFVQVMPEVQKDPVRRCEHRHQLWRSQLAFWLHAASSYLPTLASDDLITRPFSHANVVAVASLFVPR